LQQQQHVADSDCLGGPYRRALDESAARGLTHAEPETLDLADRRPVAHGKADGEPHDRSDAVSDRHGRHHLVQRCGERARSRRLYDDRGDRELYDELRAGRRQLVRGLHHAGDSAADVFPSAFAHAVAFDDPGALADPRDVRPLDGIVYGERFHGRADQCAFGGPNRG
jgi:hypothetical protein